jgi:response regulator RpfG family c-di-GMP phosphodiesterase
VNALSINRMPIVTDIASTGKCKQFVFNKDYQPRVSNSHLAILNSLRPHFIIVNINNPIHALPWDEHKQIDLIFTDCNTSQMNSMQFVLAIDKPHPIGVLPMTITRVDNNKTLYKVLMASGASVYLRKRVEADHLKMQADCLSTKGRQLPQHP